MAIVIERLTQASEQALADINNLLGQLKSEFEPETLEGLQKVVSDDHTIAMVAKDGDRIVGMAYLFIFQTLQKRSGYVEDVVVDASQQGKGVGTQLMMALVEEGRKADMTDIELTSRPSREAANKLYQKLGFVIRETNIYRLRL